MHVRARMRRSILRGAVIQGRSFKVWRRRIDVKSMLVDLIAFVAKGRKGKSSNRRLFGLKKTGQWILGTKNQKDGHYEGRTRDLGVSR